MSDCAAAVFSLQLRAVFSSLSGLLCGPTRDYSFLFGAWTCHHGDWIEGTGSGQEVAFSVKFCRQSVELCNVYVACKCICDSRRMYCYIFQFSPAFNNSFFVSFFFVFFKAGIFALLVSL